MGTSQHLLKLSSLVLILFLSAHATSQHYVNLSLPMQAAPFDQIYVLNPDSSKQVEAQTIPRTFSFANKSNY